MTGPRLLAVGALVLAAVVVAVVLLSGGGTTYWARFQTTGQLVQGDLVQIGGRPVGSIKDIELTDDNLVDISFEIDDDVAPLHEGTTATMRATSLPGVANRYISLAPGPNSAPELAEGARLGTDRTTTIVDLDQLFDTLDARTRRGLQNIIQGFAEAYDGRTKDGELVADAGNQAALYFNPFLSTSTALIGQLLADQATFNRFVVDSSRVVTAVASKRDDLASLVGNTNTTLQAIGNESQSLSQALGLLPQTLQKGNTTFVGLRSTLDDLDELVEASKPATVDLEPFLVALRPLVRDAKPTISDLSRLLRSPGPNNDATDLLRKTPALASAAGSTFPRTVDALRESTPVVAYARPYAPELVGWLRDFGQGASNYDANGHFARIQPVFNAFSFQSLTNELLPALPSQRQYGLQTNVLGRCPGTATQPRPDGSNPFLDDGNLSSYSGTVAPSPTAGCNPTLVPPGP